MNVCIMMVIKYTLLHVTVFATENARRADPCDSAIADGTPVGGII